MILANTSPLTIFLPSVNRRDCSRQATTPVSADAKLLLLSCERRTLKTRPLARREPKNKAQTGSAKQDLASAGSLPSSVTGRSGGSVSEMWRRKICAGVILAS
jgi:hypothetical protein